ncbi:MAG: ribonuclease HII [Bacteroidales bacterium]
MSLKSAYYNNLIEAGVDEAGRGCLAGPVVAAAVILPRRYRHPVLNDSKRLTARQRVEVREEIIEKAVSWHVSFVPNTVIDEMNILRATWKAMHEAISHLHPRPDFTIVDGNRFLQYEKIPFKTIIGGDGLYFSIAAASVLAKTARDEYMATIHNEFPQFGWNQNMGYPTAAHRKAIESYGITPYHRRSFSLLDRQLTIHF